MKKNKISILALGMILINAFLAFAMLSNAIYSLAIAFHYVIIDPDGMFTEECGGYTYKCYRIEGEETSIAIAWGQQPSTTPSALTIPSTIPSSKPTGELVSYDVVAIAKAGFARCTFSTVIVPQSVEDIREEAFAYCQNLESFQFPKNVEEIAPSTFIDCRNLEYVYYTNADGVRVFTNSKITSIGNHAFDSCVKLRKFQCPSTVTFFGQSCFQNCSTITLFRFPYSNGLATPELGRNDITVESYAFADCKSLIDVYFDVNMTTIENYAFTESSTLLTLHYCGSELPSSFDSTPRWRNMFINTDGEYITRLYPLEFNYPLVRDDAYPGLFYYIATADLPLDNARTDRRSDGEGTTVYLEHETSYAVIDHFEVPDAADWDEPGNVTYYRDGELHIPDEVDVGGIKYKFQVINAHAFEDKSELTQVYINENMVQIKNHAFYQSNNISLLDFSACKKLQEISYNIFNTIVLKRDSDPEDSISEKNKDIQTDAQTYNTAMTSIHLPNCLEYIGNFAFFNFTNLSGSDGISFKTDPSKPSKLKLIGDYAFAVYQDYSYSGSASIDLELPYSLDDSVAPGANIWHSFAYDRKGGTNTTFSTVNESIQDRYAVNKNAFEKQLAIRTVKMEEKPDGAVEHNTSFASNSFVRAANLIRFESNECICLIGKESFKATALREIFLQADRANNNPYSTNKPWGINDGNTDSGSGIFNTTALPECTIYVKSSNNKLPKNQGESTFNIESVDAYKLDKDKMLGVDSGARTRIPVYFVDWEDGDKHFYWHLNKTTDELTTDGPQTLDDYKNGYISFVKNTNNSNFTIARYYTDSGNVGKESNAIDNIVDLTSDTLSGKTIDTIGASAFGVDGSRNMGYYFVLPRTITTIKELAFFHKNVDDHGVRIVTFKNSSDVRQVPSGASYTFASKIAEIKAVNNADALIKKQNRRGYCCLPTSVTRIEKNAFFNNIFETVELGTNVTYIGASAFFDSKGSSAAAGLMGRITSFSFTNYSEQGVPSTNSTFSVINDGIYYTGNAAKKALLHQANGKTGTLTVDSGTKAIAFRAAAHSKYSTVAFDSDDLCTTIYGAAFAYNYNLTSLTNVDAIKYISAFSKPETEVLANSESFFDSFDNRGTSATVNTARQGAFEGCTALNLEFEDFASIKKIGNRAFLGCTNLVNFSLSRTYKFYDETETETESLNNKVLDLSRCENLRVIEQAAFTSIGENIKYVILPNTKGTDYTAVSEFYCGYDPNGNTNKAAIVDIGATKAHILVGETGRQADQSGGDKNNATTHYPTSSIGVNSTANYNYVYFRVHSTSDTFTSNTTRKFWTVFQDGATVKIILFDSKDEADTWLTANSARQVHTFF